jgi:hypothetical protein
MSNARGRTRMLKTYYIRKQRALFLCGLSCEIRIRKIPFPRVLRTLLEIGNPRRPSHPQAYLQFSKGPNGIERKRHPGKKRTKKTELHRTTQGTWRHRYAFNLLTSRGKIS